MPVRCLNCAAEMPDGMLFCGRCGTLLERAAPAARERRLVSVLFCDLVGFTTFSEARDHEDVRDVLEHYFAAARTVVAVYGGTIDKFIGDAVMAVWGAPLAREDDAERAVRAGLDMATSVAALAERLSIPELQLRVGILTGEAAVDVGSVHQGMVIGDTVNTASRIQALAEPGTVLVDDVTRLATERSIAYNPAGTHAVKGRSEPVRVWRATRVVSLRGGARRSRTVETPFVGRDAELASVRAALDELLAPGARLRVLPVIGDVGLGKSRLAWELEKYADGIATRIRWLRGRALGFGEGAGLSALAEIVRMAAGIVPDDAPGRQRETVEHWFDDLFEPDSRERARVTAAVHRLLELDDGSELIEQGALFSAWRELFEREAVRDPLVLILEELQHADQALLDFVVHLSEWAAGARILIVALGRPDARLDPLAPQRERIELRPMSDEAMDALVSGVVEDAPEQLLDAVRADGGGVPLYAVETLRSLADGGTLTIEHGHYVVHGSLSELAIPPTIRALVSARLDRLGQLERSVLAAGAVFGERFAAAGAAAVAELDEPQARALLDSLVEKSILEPEITGRSSLHGRYGFLQGVVRRVLLNTLSRRVSRQLHLAVVDHLSRGVPEPELAAQLAGHLLEAERLDPAAPDAAALRARAGATLADAGDRAAAVGALGQAVSLLDHAAELTEDDRGQAAIVERAGAVAQRAGTPDVAAERYRRAGEVHAGAGRERERLGARAHELRALRYVRAPAELLVEMRELEAALRGTPDPISALAASVLAFTLYQCDEPAEALSVAERAVETARASGAFAELVLALGAQGSSLAELERPEQAIDVYGQALALTGPNDQRLVATLAGNLAVSLGSLGRYRESAAQARDAIGAAVRAADRVFERWARLVLGRALCSLGRWEEAIAEIEAVIDHAPPFQLGMAVAPLVVIALGRGQDERVRELVHEYDRRCSDAGASVFASDFRALRAASLAIDGGDAQALQRIVPDAVVADYAEWTGWLAPVVDRLVRSDGSEPLAAALATLNGPGRMKRTPPVQAQARRLEAHMAARAGDQHRAVASWTRALELATSSGTRFDAAVIGLERAEHESAGESSEALAIFEELRAEPWIARARRVTAGS